MNHQQFDASLSSEADKAESARLSEDLVNLNPEFRSFRELKTYLISQLAVDVPDNVSEFMGVLHYLAETPGFYSGNLIVKCFAHALALGFCNAREELQFLEEKYREATSVGHAKVLIVSISKINFDRAVALSGLRPLGIEVGLEYYLSSTIYSHELPFEKNPALKKFRSELVATLIEKSLAHVERNAGNDSLVLCLTHSLLDNNRIEEANAVLETNLPQMTNKTILAHSMAYRSAIRYMKGDFAKFDSDVQELVNAKATSATGPSLYSVRTLAELGRLDLVARFLEVLNQNQYILSKMLVEYIDSLLRVCEIKDHLMANLYGGYRV